MKKLEVILLSSLMTLQYDSKTRMIFNTKKQKNIRTNNIDKTFLSYLGGGAV